MKPDLTMDLLRVSSALQTCYETALRAGRSELAKALKEHGMFVAAEIRKVMVSGAEEAAS